MSENLVIIGSGTAGYTAAIYAGRAQLQPLVFEGFVAGGLPGGQLMTTTEVENFPGFVQGIQGPQLMQEMRQQALRWGVQLITDDVVSVDFSQYPFMLVAADGQEVRARAVIVCTGATAKRLHLPGEEQFWNNGVSACAICDGANPLFANAEIAVVGGGDSAIWEVIPSTAGSRVMVWWEPTPKSRLLAPVILPMLAFRADSDFPKIIQRMTATALGRDGEIQMRSNAGVFSRLLPSFC